ncbi:hypothetical protein D3C81_1214500 [compost metagenome]
MIVGQCQVHHRTDNDLTIDGHRTLDDVVHAQNRCLRRVDDRGRHHRTEGTTVGDGEGTAGHFFDRQFAVTGFLAEGGDAVLDFSQAHQLGVTQNRYYQAAVAGYGNADVRITVVDDVGTVDRGVDSREAFQRFGGSLDEERHEAQAHAIVGLLEQVLVLRTQGHDFGHVDFVEGGQHGHVRLCFDQTLGHGGTYASHRYTLLGAIASRNHWCSGGSGRLGSWSGGRRGFLRFDSRYNVFLGDAAVFTGALDAVQGNAVLFGQLASSRRADGVFVASSSGRCSSGSRSGGSGRRSGSNTTFFDRTQDFVGQDGFALALDDSAQYAVGGSQYFQDNLVSLDVDDQFVTLDCFARLLVPGGNGAIGNRFRESRGFDLDSHYQWFLKFGF